MNFFSEKIEKILSNTTILTLLTWIALPAPDLVNILSTSSEISFLPAVGPASTAYGLSALLYQFSRKMMWGYFPGGGLNFNFYIEAFTVGISSLIVAYLIALGVKTFSGDTSLSTQNS